MQLRETTVYHGMLLWITFYKNDTARRPQEGEKQTNMASASTKITNGVAVFDQR